MIIFPEFYQNKARVTKNGFTDIPVNDVTEMHLNAVLEYLYQVLTKAHKIKSVIIQENSGNIFVTYSYLKRFKQGYKHKVFTISQIEKTKRYHFRYFKNLQIDGGLL